MYNLRFENLVMFNKHLYKSSYGQVKKTNDLRKPKGWTPNVTEKKKSVGRTHLKNGAYSEKP